MTETTIVGWDGSAPAQAALEWAAAWTSGGELTVARVLEDSIGITDYIVDASTVDAARTALEDATARLRLTQPDLDVHSTLVRGDPIGELRRRSGPDRLIVVGTHRREGSRMRFEWSVGARLAASAHGPVAIVPDADSTARFMRTAPGSRSGSSTPGRSPRPGRARTPFPACRARSSSTPSGTPTGRFSMNR